jgi:nonribosomal peptide synthetase DhbF
MLPLRRNGNLPPLFCIHPAAGLSLGYAGLIQYLEPERPLYGLQARGLSQLQVLPRSVDEMALDYIKEIRKIQPRGPYHFLGWSFGGIVAYAVAAQFQQQDERVALLALLDAYPSVDQSPTNSGSEDLVAGRMRNLGYSPGSKDLDPETIRELLWRHGHIPQALNRNQLACMLNIYKNNLKLAASFMPNRFVGDLLFFAAKFTADAAAPNPEAWNVYIDGRITIHVVECQHHEMIAPAPLTKIGAVLALELQRRVQFKAASL